MLRFQFKHDGFGSACILLRRLPNLFRQRLDTVGHAEAHKAGFTHLEHGNTIKGNEQSVPYLVNAAFDACPNGDNKE
jgi:hypothetical protein